MACLGKTRLLRPSCRLAGTMGPQVPGWREGTPRAWGLQGARPSGTLAHETNHHPGGQGILLQNRTIIPRRFPHSGHQPRLQPSLCPVPKLPQGTRAHLVQTLQCGHNQQPGPRVGTQLCPHPGPGGYFYSLLATPAATRIRDMCSGQPLDSAESLGFSLRRRGSCPFAPGHTGGVFLGRRLRWPC